LVIGGQAISTISPVINPSASIFTRRWLVFHSMMTAIRVISDLSRPSYTGSSREVKTNLFHVSLFPSTGSIYTSPLSQAACGMRVTCDFGLGEARRRRERGHGAQYHMARGAEACAWRASRRLGRRRTRWWRVDDLWVAATGNSLASLFP
jgi:hypothetical protein